MTIQIRDDRGTIRNFLFIIDKSPKKAIEFLILNYFSERKNLLNEKDIKWLGYLELENNSFNSKINKALAYQGSNIRNLIKDMIIKGIDIHSILNCVNIEIAKNKNNDLIKQELVEIRKMNTLKNYKFLKDVFLEFRLKRHYTDIQLMNLDLEVLLKHKGIINKDTQEADFNKTELIDIKPKEEKIKKRR